MPALLIAMLSMVMNVYPVTDGAFDFDSVQIPYTPLETLNWPEAFPYKPTASIRAAYSQHALFLQFRVTEEAVLATYEDDATARSWEDSCVEFFVQPSADRPDYYNFEFTCIGTCLMGRGTGRAGRYRYPVDVTSRIERHSTLGNKAFGLKKERTEWVLTVVIPWSIFDECDTPVAGRTMKANFYKCGDKTPVPHFVSWSPVLTAKPDFHRPEYFGTLLFR
ncbi:MAG: carbohydrate-binding family 9-like protein [Bacteroidales bacterium]|jgi:hypothetical protein